MRSPKVPCIPPEIYAFPESPMRSRRNLLHSPESSKRSPGIYTFPRKSSTFSRKIVEFGDLSEPPPTEILYLRLKTRLFPGGQDHFLENMIIVFPAKDSAGGCRRRMPLIAGSAKGLSVGLMSTLDPSQQSPVDLQRESRPGRNRQSPDMRDV